MAVFRVKKEKDYTVMHNHHFRNRNLSLKAMGLLSLMLSLPESWDFTLAGLAAICNDGISSVRSGVNELEEHGYLIRRRLRQPNGQLGDIEYTILEIPHSQPPTPSGDEPPVGKLPKKGKTSKDEPTPSNINCSIPVSTEKSPPILCEPILEKPVCENPTQALPTYEERTQLSTKESSTNALNIHQSIYSSINHTPKEIDEINTTDRIDRMEAQDTYRELLKENIEYDYLCEQEPHSIDEINEILELMLETVCTNKKTIRVGGENKPVAVVKSQMMKLDSTHIEYVLECLSNNTTNIRNIKSYLLTTIYNAPMTIGSYYKSRVNHDFRGDKTRAG